MYKIFPVEITEADDIAAYGTLYNASGHGTPTGNVNFWSGEGWSDRNTANPLMSSRGFIGLTTAVTLPCEVDFMERHMHTDEVLLPAGRPICFLLAKPDMSGMIAVILREGFFFSIHAGIWHSPAHGIGSEAPYYYIADVYEGEPTSWNEIPGGPAYICLPEET